MEKIPSPFAVLILFLRPCYLGLKLPDLFGGKIRLIGAAYRAYPVFGKILKFRSRLDSRIRVSLFRVINVSTDGTDVSGHCILLMFKFRLIRLISRRIYRRLTTLNGMIIGIGQRFFVL